MMMSAEDRLYRLLDRAQMGLMALHETIEICEKAIENKLAAIDAARTSPPPWAAEASRATRLDKEAA